MAAWLNASRTFCDRKMRGCGPLGGGGAADAAAGASVAMASAIAASCARPLGASAEEEIRTGWGARSEDFTAANITAPSTCVNEVPPVVRKHSLAWRALCWK